MEICDLAKALDAFYEIGKERKECNALVQCFGIKYADIIEVQHISPNKDSINSPLSDPRNCLLSISKQAKEHYESLKKHPDADLTKVEYKI